MKLKVRREIITKKVYVGDVEYAPNIDYFGEVDCDLPLVLEDIVDDNTTVWRADTMEVYEAYEKGEW